MVWGAMMLKCRHNNVKPAHAVKAEIISIWHHNPFMELFKTENIWLIVITFSVYVPHKNICIVNWTSNKYLLCQSSIVFNSRTLNNGASSVQCIGHGMRGIILNEHCISVSKETTLTLIKIDAGKHFKSNIISVVHIYNSEGFIVW